MAATIHETQKAEFWRPADPETSSTLLKPRLCPQCETEMAVGARFCHVCGAAREGKRSNRLVNFSALIHSVDWAGLRGHIGLNTAALVPFAAGVICLLCAIFVAVIYQVQSTLDWQAIQVWRIQWLLGAIALFFVSSLLRRSKQ